jgi:DNA-binding winged helix-turn-helix (wHTH) protein
MSLENSTDFLLNLSVRDVNEEDKHFYHFKSFRLDVAERRLLNNGVPVPLMPKVFEVLALLVERHGHLVEKNELFNTVWADTFVEETNITRIIHELRKVLGEGKNADKYIETVAKKGYRFVAEVEKVSKLPAPKPGNGNGKRDSGPVRTSNSSGKGRNRPNFKTETKNAVYSFQRRFSECGFSDFIAVFQLSIRLFRQLESKVDRRSSGKADYHGKP